MFLAGLPDAFDDAREVMPEALIVTVLDAKKGGFAVASYRAKAVIDVVHTSRVRTSRTASDSVAEGTLIGRLPHHCGSSPFREPLVRRPPPAQGDDASTTKLRDHDRECRGG